MLLQFACKKSSLFENDKNGQIKTTTVLTGYIDELKKKIIEDYFAT